MGRAAGDSSHYTFVLYNEETGKHEKDVEIKLPSVTHIIQSVLAKHALVPWAYRQTLDAFVGIVDLVREGGLAIEVLIDSFSDEAMAQEFMKENKLRPEDVARDDAARGRREHKALETLAHIYKIDGAAAAIEYATVIKEHPESSGWTRGIADWWLLRKPEVQAAEARVWSLKHGFAGTADLIYDDVLCDLKTRRADRDIYRADHVQTGGYLLAADETQDFRIDQTTVLLVTQDGNFKEESAVFDNVEAFIKTKALYDELRRKGV